MLVLPALLATAGVGPDAFTFVAPAGWSAQSVQRKQRNGWVLVRMYSPPDATVPQSIEISRGPLKGLSIADYAYLEVEGIKHDMPDVVIEVNHEQKVCGNVESWLLVYHHSVEERTEQVYETLIGTERGSYRAVYSHAAADKSDAGAISALDSLCPQ